MSGEIDPNPPIVTYETHRDPPIKRKRYMVNSAENKRDRYLANAALWQVKADAEQATIDKYNSLPVPEQQIK